jgi:hypothetical protein
VTYYSVCVCVFARAHAYSLVGVAAKGSFYLKKYKRGWIEVISPPSLHASGMINVTLNFPDKFTRAYILGSGTLSRSHLTNKDILPVKESITI